ncbi:hypothetical protein K8R32_03145 [bacterium]|nr:hypothetical protein [bacterium]
MKKFSKILIKIGISLGILLSFIFSLVNLSEFISVGIISNPELVEKYSFGSPAFLGYGGWHYLTKEIYIINTFISGLIWGIISILLVFSLFKKNLQKKLLIFCLILFTLFIAYALTLRFVITPISKDYLIDRSYYFTSCDWPIDNPFKESLRYDGFEAARNLDYCGGYEQEFSEGCEEFLLAKDKHYKKCVER